MTLTETLSSAGRPRWGLQRTFALGLLVAAQAIHCAPSRPAQRASSAAPSPVAPPSSAITKGPEPQAQPAATAAVAGAVEGVAAGDKIPDGAIVGRIVSSHRGDDGTMTLYLDQGSKSELRVNMTGAILEGGEGGKKLDGAAFTVTKVLGDHQAVATTNYGKSLGSNRRFLIFRPK